MLCPSVVTPRLAMLVALLVAAAGCHDQSSVASNPGGQTTADEQLFQSALAAFRAADSAQDAGDTTQAAAKYLEAKNGFEQLLATYPDSKRRDNAQYLVGRCLYETHDYNGALQAFARFAQDYPTSPMRHEGAYYTGRSRFELADYAGALGDFRQALQLDASGVYADNASYYAGRSEYEAGNFKSAQAELAAFESAWPTSTYLDNARYYLGRSFFDDTPKNYASAIPPFERVFQTPSSIYADNARYYLGRCRYGLGQLDAALGDFQTVVTSFPSSQYLDNSLYYELRVYVDKADCTSARSMLDQLRQKSPTSPELPLAQSYLASGGC